MGLAATVLARAATAARPARSLGAPPLSTAVKTHSASRRGRSLGRGKLTLRDTSCSERVKEAVREGRAAAISRSRPHLIGKSGHAGRLGSTLGNTRYQFRTPDETFRSADPVPVHFWPEDVYRFARSRASSFKLASQDSPDHVARHGRKPFQEIFSRNRVLYSMSVSTAGTSRSHAASLRCVQQCTRMALEVWQAAADLVAWSPSHV